MGAQAGADPWREGRGNANPNVNSANSANDANDANVNTDAGANANANASASANASAHANAMSSVRDWAAQWVYACPASLNRDPLRWFSTSFLGSSRSPSLPLCILPRIRSFWSDLQSVLTLLHQ